MQGPQVPIRQLKLAYSKFSVQLLRMRTEKAYQGFARACERRFRRMSHHARGFWGLRGALQFELSVSL